MHAAHPFIAIWDDHESENNNAGANESPSTTPGQTNNGFPRRVPYLERRANGYKAFFNFHPRTRFKGERDRIYEDYRLGKLVDLILTDERQYRDIQPCGDGIVTPCPEADDPRGLLGAAQKDWWKRTLQRLPRQLEGVGQPGDADELRDHRHHRRDQSTSGTATRPSAGS